MMCVCDRADDSWGVMCVCDRADDSWGVAGDSPAGRTLCRWAESPCAGALLLVAQGYRGPRWGPAGGRVWPGPAELTARAASPSPTPRGPPMRPSVRGPKTHTGTHTHTHTHTQSYSQCHDR